MLKDIFKKNVKLISATTFYSFEYYPYFPNNWVNTFIVPFSVFSMTISRITKMKCEWIQEKNNCPQMGQINT